MMVLRYLDSDIQGQYVGNILTFPILFTETMKNNIVLTYELKNPII